MTDHLRKNEQSYWQHMIDSFRFASVAAVAALAFIVHGVLPCTFEHTGSYHIHRLDAEIQTKIAKCKHE